MLWVVTFPPLFLAPWLDNVCCNWEGGLYLEGVNVSLLGLTACTNNWAEAGGGILIEDCSIIFIRHLMLQDNVSDLGGGFSICYRRIVIVKRLLFCNNVGYAGRGILLDNHILRWQKVLSFLKILHPRTKVLFLQKMVQLWSCMDTLFCKQFCFKWWSIKHITGFIKVHSEWWSSIFK